MIQAILAFIAGLVAHHGFFIRGEWHLRIEKILATHLLVASLLVLLMKQNTDAFAEVFQSLGRIIVFYLTSLFGSITIYRLFFHRLSHFPGPKLAAVSKLWHVFHILDSKNFRFMQRIHHQYGDFVRTGPNEIAIFHPDGLYALDGWNNENSKDVWYDLLHPMSSAIFTRDPQDHKERRKPWAQSFSRKSMGLFHPRIATISDKLVRCIERHEGEATNVCETMRWFALDIVGEIMFGEDFKMLDTQINIPFTTHRARAIAVLGPFADALWIARLAFVVLPFSPRARDYTKTVEFAYSQIKERMQRGPKDKKFDMSSLFIEEYHSLKSSKTLEERNNLLAGSVVSAVMAGSETTQAALIATWWFLAKYPTHADKIRSEVCNIDIDNHDALAALPHLNGVVNEVLRLVPPALTGTPRVTGPNGLVVDGTFIPPFTKVVAPRYVIKRRDSAFVHPDEFIPERWYSRPELILHSRAFAPFSYGTRQCLGKPLAYAELRLVTAKLVHLFNVRFAPGYDEDIMWRDMRDQATAQPGKLMCVFERRTQADSTVNVNKGT